MNNSPVYFFAGLQSSLEIDDLKRKITELEAENARLHQVEQKYLEFMSWLAADQFGKVETKTIS